MFRHIGIVVEDLEKQLFFYKDLLGLEIYYNELEKGEFLNKILKTENTQIKIIKLGKFNKTIVELLKFKDYFLPNEKRSIKSFGYTHFAITVDNLNKLYLSLKENNVEFLSSPLLNNSGEYLVCFCKDYEGNFIELVQVI
jgi:catechol 2,3-dioxygenase-like lactoylglutathione lyase family enzyme